VHRLIVNLPNSAQLGGSLYHTPKLHPGPCNSVGVRPRTDRQTDKPVGFYGRIATQFRTPPVPNAPSSACPRASIATHRRAGSIRISRRASCCCSSAIAEIAIGTNFKIYLLRQFFSNRVHFYNTQETQTQKMMDQNFEIRIL